MSEFSDNSKDGDGGSRRFESSKGFGWGFVRFAWLSEFSENLVGCCAEVGRFETSNDFGLEFVRFVWMSEFSDYFVAGLIDSEDLILQVT